MNVTVDFLKGDLFQPVTGEKFDVLVSNPPYVSEQEYDQCFPEVKYEPPQALLGGSDGLDFYRRIAAGIDEFLCPGGSGFLEIGFSQGSMVAELFAARGFKTLVIPDYAGLDRIVRVTRP
jgi:release factor glutamine methyltransferase